MLKKIKNFLNTSDSKEYKCAVDVSAKFYCYLRIEGWIASDLKRNDLKDYVKSIKINHPNVKNYSYSANESAPSLGKKGKLKKRFTINIFLEKDEFPDDLSIIIQISDKKIQYKLQDLCMQRILLYNSLKITQEFKDIIKTDSTENPRLIDIGGRDRSKLDRSSMFKDVDCTVFDVLKGKNVDVVGDAHELGKIFEKNQFDAAMSICVFEHLAMPWKVVIEMNRILKVGAPVLIHTHQTIGLHDLPWDFYRFSEESWDTLFNKRTGFEIINKGSDFEQFIIPFIWHKGKLDAEKSAGREASWVIARKTHDTDLEWGCSVKDCINTQYPSNEDGNKVENNLINLI